MKTDKIMAGIWNAKTPAELSSHLDAWESALDLGECDYGISELLDLSLAMCEVIANDFKRVLRL